jgi:peptidoglycan lytic transglycosylase
MVVRGRESRRGSAFRRCVMRRLPYSRGERRGSWRFHLNLLATILLTGVSGDGGAGSTPDARSAEGAISRGDEASRQPTGELRPQPDLSGRKRVGKASFYAKKFAGRQMADGTKMNPQGENAASKTLPLGTTAKVTNVETGQCAVVTIQDRGPYEKGRIVDLSPHTAQEIGITRDNGLTEVQVAPIAVPLPDGNTKPGVAAQDAKPGDFTLFAPRTGSKTITAQCSTRGDSSSAAPRLPEKTPKKRG